MTKQQGNKEIQILLALYGATVEQMEMLRGEHKHQVKQMFNKWVKEGQKYMDVVEKYVLETGMTEDYDTAKDLIHDSVNNLRNKM